MSDDYGQFCTVARAAEVLCERWTPLVVRELLCGSKRFNDLHRGVPRMSTSLLAQRLRRLRLRSRKWSQTETPRCTRRPPLPWRPRPGLRRP